MSLEIEESVIKGQRNNKNPQESQGKLKKVVSPNSFSFIMKLNTTNEHDS